MTSPAAPEALRRALPWAGYAALLWFAPLLFPGAFSVSLISQVGIAIVACLSFNLLFGQGGMLSFGHAVYSGLGAFAAIHALNRVADGSLALPVSLVPLAGGLAGLASAALLGWFTTRRSGTVFAMITLGIGELVAAVALAGPAFFGGEGGVTANRVIGPPVLGISFGPAIEVCRLIAIYTVACTAALYAFTHTPLGRLLQAVRDNAERAAFVGHDPRTVRYLAFVIAGFFAGIAGGLQALNFEVVTAEAVGAARSGAYLVFTVIGGSSCFAGPIVGGVLLVAATVLLSGLTRAWGLYLGLAFIAVVMLAPGGLAGVAAAQWRLARAGRLRPRLGGHLALGGTALAAFAGFAAIVEMVYQRQVDDTMGPVLRFFGITLDTGSRDAWGRRLAAMATGGGLFALARRVWRRETQATAPAAGIRGGRSAAAGSRADAGNWRTIAAGQKSGPRRRRPGPLRDAPNC